MWLSGVHTFFEQVFKDICLPAKCSFPPLTPHQLLQGNSDSVQSKRGALACLLRCTCRCTSSQFLDFSSFSQDLSQLGRRGKAERKAHVSAFARRSRYLSTIRATWYPCVTKWLALGVDSSSTLRQQSKLGYQFEVLKLLFQPLHSLFSVLALVN